jgi:hypothetical protein
MDIPTQQGYENGNEIYLVTFDASTANLAQKLTNQTGGFPVHYTEVLTQTPPSALEDSYIFENGIEGNGHFGFQPTVVSAKPNDVGYSPLKHVSLVKWIQPEVARELKSVDEIVAAQQAGELTINSTSKELVINTPAIKWQGGSLKIRADNVITDDTPFIGGQVTQIDTEKMIVTMIVMRGYGPDGKTLYWLATDATPLTDDISKGGIIYSPADELLAPTAVAVDFYQFINGIKGAGPQGFQPPIAATNLEDSNYSPMWRILFVAWKNPQEARVLHTLSDIAQMSQAGQITVFPVFEGKHIVNCPFFDQSTVLKYRHEYTLN